MKAQELKDKIAAAKKEKESLAELAESADMDALKKFATPKSSAVKKAVVDSALSSEKGLVLENLSYKIQL